MTFQRVLSFAAVVLLLSVVAFGQTTGGHITSGAASLAGQQISPLAVWTSATPLNAVATVLNNTFAYGSCSVSLVQTTTITGGAASWETSVDGVNWFTIGAIDAVSGTPVPNNIVTFQANTNRLIQSDVTGYSFFRVRLSTQISGTGSVTLASACQGAGSPSLTTAYQGNPPWATQDVADMTGTVSGTAPGFTQIAGGIFNSAAPTPSNGQTLPFQLNASGALKTDESAVTQPIAGQSASNTTPTNPVEAAGLAFNTANGNPTAATSSNQVQLLADQNGALFVRPEGGPNQFNCSVTLSTATTTQCQSAPGAGLRAYITGFIINTTTAGTASTVQAIQGTGSNCGTNTTNLSAIAFPNTSTGMTSVEYSRVGLVPVAAEAVCFKQTGTPGTSVVEAYGFIAP